MMFLINRLKPKYDKIMTEIMIAGNVNKSPTAAMIGVVILSGSQPCLKLLNEISIVTGSIMRLEITPAIMLINMKSIKETDSKCMTIHNTLAIIAKNKDKINVKTNEETILLFSCSDSSNFGDIIPMCRLVESLEANDPKMFPLIPIAPGIITSKPGNVSKKNVIFPNTIPANKSPNAQINKAIKLSFMIESCSEMKFGNEDSEVRILFFFAFMHITTSTHNITSSSV